MGLKTRILGPVSAAVLLSVPVVAMAALQPWSERSSEDRTATLALVDGVQPIGAEAAGDRVVDLSDWAYTGKSDKSAKSNKSKKSPKSVKSDKSKKSKKSDKSKKGGGHSKKFDQSPKGNPPHHPGNAKGASKGNAKGSSKGNASHGRGR